MPEDELGNGYEFLIKKFADDSGHTAQEFYTNRTLVHLMTLMLEPKPGESIYDPTCGTGGMLISALAEVKRKRGEHRTLKLYGQERNLMTSAIARMNLFLHGVEDSEIARGDTLAAPAFHEGDRLKTFDVVLANPPYSIKQWNREAWTTDPWGRNFLGTPPQGRADYAFFQHILKSMDPKTGRCAILFPHGVLFREGGGRAAHEARRSRPRRLRPRARPEPLLQLADGGVRRLLPRQEAAEEARQGAAHRRGERGRSRAGDELPAARAPAAHRGGATTRSPTRRASPRSRPSRRSPRKATASRSRST